MRQIILTYTNGLKNSDSKIYIFQLNLRRSFFWFLDQLKGSPIKKAYHYTHKILETEDHKWSKIENANQLNKLMVHAQQTTSFYKKTNYKVLQDFPVVDKNIIRNDFDSFFSSKFKKSECKIVTTSGSTGTPFSVYQNSEKVNKVHADNIYFSSKSGYQVGDFLTFIRIWPKRINFKLRLSFFLKNFMPWSILNHTEKDINKFILKLNKRKGQVCFLTYPAALEKTCKYIDGLDENPIKFKTKSIITVSESLSTYARGNTKKYFGITPLSRYSNSETGIIAQQMNSNDQRFRVNESSYVIEVLTLDSDRPVPNGQPGRIVLTDLFNFATPLIRYDTGDIGVMQEGKDGMLYFTEISGRKVDQLYNTKGDLIPSHLSVGLLNYGDFKQFQLIQKSKTEYHINFNTDKKVNEAKIIKDYKVHFGQNAIIKIHYVNEIPLLSSGKRREVVNEYYK
ncbi:CoF synthetase [Winogradskyella sp.]|jgi:phenylacetate-CoA ligase|uniref:CoF synthetase n=1 Tax=Winogradskyella sp. TaxID=1883156 RepID=UPI0025D37990|nr:CoF synthetase [Winogradskyella sp.]MCT4629746.1 CoF synthetase [Winogradskyella sp.]